MLQKLIQVDRQVFLRLKVAQMEFFIDLLPRSIDRETDRNRTYGDRDQSKIVFCQNSRSPTDRRSYNSRPDHHYSRVKIHFHTSYFDTYYTQHWIDFALFFPYLAHYHCDFLGGRCTSISCDKRSENLCYRKQMAQRPSMPIMTTASKKTSGFLLPTSLYWPLANFIKQCKRL